ncbi:Uncharacterised protein [Mycobacteroides abscessus subsp. abscessus]|nr:Uncharacterised protein [Mycobacteroides abscessus subsp. abscessus]
MLAGQVPDHRETEAGAGERGQVGVGLTVTVAGAGHGEFGTAHSMVTTTPAGTSEA